MGDLYEKYYKWIDWSVYEGLSEDEQEKLEAEHVEKYGINHVLKKDAPPEAVKAWKEDAAQTKEAMMQGLIVD